MVQHQGFTEYYIQYTYLFTLCQVFGGRISKFDARAQATLWSRLEYTVVVVGKCVSESPRVKSANRSSFSTAAAALSALLFQPREHHDRRRRFQFTVRTQNKVSNLERRVEQKKQDHVFLVGGG